MFLTSLFGDTDDLALDDAISLKYRSDLRIYIPIDS